jgi:hypothetical protein
MRLRLGMNTGHTAAAVVTKVARGMTRESGECG